jgi:Pyruvate/2-oxoacid:ferredoxin oxidoreductase delta subunit
MKLCIIHPDVNQDKIVETMNKKHNTTSRKKTTAKPWHRPRQIQLNRRTIQQCIAYCKKNIIKRDLSPKKYKTFTWTTKFKTWLP